MGKLEYLLGNHKEALEILKEIPIKDDFLFVLNINDYYFIYQLLFIFIQGNWRVFFSINK